MKARHLPGLVMLTGLLVCGGASRAQAIPLLQLDIKGGYYDLTTQTVVATGPKFDLYAIVNNSSPSDVLALDNLYVSAAVVPRMEQQPVAPELGSISLDGKVVNVTGDMEYGTPPLVTVLGVEEGSLAPHGVFATYFTELSIGKVGATARWKQAKLYDTALTPGGPTESGTNAWVYWIPVDLSDLAAGHDIHFDLYSEALKQDAKAGIKRNVNQNDPTAKLDFAPFSHDGEGAAPVPEPASLLLLGTGLALAGKVVRRKK